MYIKTLKLSNFKNHIKSHMQLDEHVNIFVGNNGMGKTNLLDSIHMACYGRSYFSSKEVHIKNYDAHFYRVEAHICKHGHDEKAVVKYDGQQKTIEVDDVAVQSLLDYLGRYPVIMICPGDIELVYGTAEVRRRFIDQILGQVDKSYLKHLMTYNRVLKQRNSFLKQMGDRAKAQPLVVEAWDVQLVNHGTAIFEKRRQFLSDLEGMYIENYSSLGGKNDVIKLSFKSQVLDVNFKTGLQKSWEKDVVLRRTNFGVHKDDILLEKDDMLLRKVGSQGQIKTAVLALKIAQIQHMHAVMGHLPILLLDDIFDKLDPHRIKSLISELVDKQKGQLFITDAFKLRLLEILDDINMSSFKIWSINDGHPELIHA